jgi:hypothetical protein
LVYQQVIHNNLVRLDAGLQAVPTAIWYYKIAAAQYKSLPIKVINRIEAGRCIWYFAAWCFAETCRNKYKL